MYALILNENSFPYRYVMVGLVYHIFEYDNSRKITSSLVSAIKDQVTTYEINKKDINHIKNEIKSAKEKRCIDLLNNLKKRNVRATEKTKSHKLSKRCFKLVECSSTTKTRFRPN